MESMTIEVRFHQASVFGRMLQTYRNITEVHYGYRPGRIAFESDIDRTGYTHDMADIESMVITVDAAPAPVVE